MGEREREEERRRENEAMAPTIRTLLAALLVALVMVVGGSRAVMANSISDQMKQMREQMQMRMDGIMQAQREDAESADGVQPRRKHYRPQRSSAFRDHADELLVSKHAKKQRVFDLERRYFNELLPVRENVHLFIILVFLRWFGRCIEWERDQLRQGCLGN